MTNWHYFIDIGKKVTVTEERFKELAAQGVITEGTLVQNEKGVIVLARCVEGLKFVEETPRQATGLGPESALALRDGLTLTFCSNCGTVSANCPNYPRHAAENPCNLCRFIGFCDYEKFCNECGVDLNPGQAVCAECGCTECGRIIRTPCEKDAYNKAIWYGRATVFVAAILAVISLFLPWIEVMTPLTGKIRIDGFMLHSLFVSLSPETKVPVPIVVPIMEKSVTVNAFSFGVYLFVICFIVSILLMVRNISTNHNNPQALPCCYNSPFTYDRYREIPGLLGGYICAGIGLCFGIGQGWVLSSFIGDPDDVVFENILKGALKESSIGAGTYLFVCACLALIVGIGLQHRAVARLLVQNTSEPKKSQMSLCGDILAMCMLVGFIGFFLVSFLGEMLSPPYFYISKGSPFEPGASMVVAAITFIITPIIAICVIWMIFMFICDQVQYIVDPEGWRELRDGEGLWTDGLALLLPLLVVAVHIPLTLYLLSYSSIASDVPISFFTCIFPFVLLLFWTAMSLGVAWKHEILRVRTEILSPFPDRPLRPFMFAFVSLSLACLGLLHPPIYFCYLGLLHPFIYLCGLGAFLLCVFLLHLFLDTGKILRTLRSVSSDYDIDYYRMIQHCREIKRDGSRFFAQHFLESFEPIRQEVESALKLKLNLAQKGLYFLLVICVINVWVSISVILVILAKLASGWWS